MSQAINQPAFTSIEGFEAWAEGQPGRWELHDGLAVAMAPERAVHTRVKANVYVALRRGVTETGVPCEALFDGLMVPGPGLRRFVPDVFVVCGSRPPDAVQLVEAPTILVEVASPATDHIDHGIKLASYLALRSVQHYLLVSTTRRMVVHHRRWSDDRFLTAIVADGQVDLTPPGLTLAIADIYAGTEIAD